MSIHVIADVWDTPLPSSSMKIVLLALADFANRDGKKCFPSLRSLCSMCSLSESTVKAQIREMEGMGLLTRQPEFDRSGRQTTNYFEISLGKLSALREGGRGRQPPGEGATAAPSGGRQPPPCTRTDEPPEEPKKEEGDSSSQFQLSESPKQKLEAPKLLADFPAATMVRIWNECVPGAKIQALAGQRKTHAGARWKELGGSIAEWTLFCNRVGQSPFLTGKTKTQSKRSFTAHFDWCIMPGNFLKIQEGKYQTKSEPEPKTDKAYDW